MKRGNVKAKPLVVIQCYEDRQPTLPVRKSEPLISAQPVPNIANGQTKGQVIDAPPPPPPMPALNGHQNGESKTKDPEVKSISKMIPPDVMRIQNFRKNGTLTRTPTPDYNAKGDSIQMKNGNNEKAELESLESYKLKNPISVPPKPPTNYFMKAPNGSATMKKIVRPVSVTIGEYAFNGTGRREPTKLDFLGSDRTDGPQNGTANDDSSISNRLQSELALTLSRSNLRKKTEALADTGR